MLVDRHRQALCLMLHAHEYAKDTNCDPWQFALSMGELETIGLATPDIRWLLMKNYAALGMELTVPGDPVRSFRPVPITSINRAAGIILTLEGAEYLNGRLKISPPPPVPGSHSNLTREHAKNDRRPRWDSGRRELRVGSIVVKRFRVPAPNQELILQVFEEEGWPHSIDDPLPPVLEVDCQQRLRATIKSLNRCHIVPLVRFHANGGGQVICWDYQPSP